MHETIHEMIGGAERWTNAVRENVARHVFQPTKRAKMLVLCVLGIVMAIGLLARMQMVQAVAYLDCGCAQDGRLVRFVQAFLFAHNLSPLVFQQSVHQGALLPCDRPIRGIERKPYQANLSIQ